MGQQSYLRFNPGNIVGNVHQGCDVDSELSKDRADNVNVEDIWLRPFLRQALHRLSLRVSDWFILFYGLEDSENTFAREIDKKQTLMSIPLIVT